MLPNFIIPGVPKSGTTSLYFYLEEHPEIVLSSEKEPYFFCGPIDNQKIADYKKLFVGKSGAKAIGESSVVYIYSKKAALRIKKMLGNNVKFIFVLRNPVDRTISAYLHMAKRNADKRPIDRALHLAGATGEDILKQEKESIETSLKKKDLILGKAKHIPDEPLQQFYYIRNSFYSMFIKEYFKLFPRENFLFIFTEDLKNKPVETIKKIENFLKVDNTFIPKDLSVIHNVTYVPDRSMKSRLIYSSVEFLTKYLNVNSKTMKRLYGIFIRSKKSGVGDKTKQILKDIFEKELKDLGHLINFDLKKVWS